MSDLITGLRYVTVWVRDYDEALKWYTQTLGFEVRDNEPMGDEGRWVTVAPKGQDWPRIILHRAMASQPAQDKAWIERHVGDNSGWMVSTDDVRKTYDELSRKGVKFTEKPTTEEWGTYAIFEDLYGNEYVLNETEE